MVALLVVLGAGAVIALTSNWAVFAPVGTERGLALERLKRVTFFGFGMPLPGTPALDKLDARLADRGLKLGQPIFMRIFKREFELEIWMQGAEGFRHLATYPICRWSGRLGPKLKTGDYQAPEGFYWVSSQSLNPNSRWHRSFNLGFPNQFDRAHGRTGSFLMVHGGCGSVGCYAMTDSVIDEIWRIVTAALEGGQSRFQVQAFPFRMTEENLGAASQSPQHNFWSSLKSGHDLFESTRTPPLVRMCRGSYVAEPGLPGSDGSTPLLARCADGDA
ncbi:MAG: hypothetical protein AB7L18_09440 [Hyphomicrobiaceae bacterium]